MWQEVVVTCFKIRILSICVEELRELMKHLSHNDRSLG
jgi:hypothetical protein